MFWRPQGQDPWRLHLTCCGRVFKTWLTRAYGTPPVSFCFLVGPLVSFCSSLDRKYFIGGGIVVTVAVIIVIVVVTVALTASTSSSEFVVADGSPVIIGYANNWIEIAKCFLKIFLARIISQTTFERSCRTILRPSRSIRTWGMIRFGVPDRAVLATLIWSDWNKDEWPLW